MFKKVSPLALAILLCADAQSVTLPYHDAFSYAEGRLNDVGGPNWIAGSTGAEISVSNSATLAAPAGFSTSSGRGLRRAPSGTSRRSVLQFTPSQTAVDGNTLYVSFLLNVQVAPSSAQIILHLDSSSSSVTSPDMAFFLDSGPKVGIGKNASAPGFTMATNLGIGAHLIVGRYTFQAGNDKVDLWVDPSGADYGAGAAPVSVGSATSSGDPTSIDYCQIVTSSGGGEQFIDEFRIGTTWAEVVPSGAALVGQKLGFTIQPAGAVTGATMNPVAVQVQTSSGASVASNNVPVTLLLTSGGGNLGGTTTRNTDSSGKATFNDLTIDIAGADKQFTASASGIGAGLVSVVSSTFAITNTIIVTTNAVPVITQIQLTPAGLAIRGNNGPTNGVYRVINSTNVILPRSQWAVIATNIFDSLGNFASTNPFALTGNSKFYCLLLGGELPVAPSITTQPQNQSVIVSNTANFSVIAAGTAPLRYQWYFNTNTPLANATNDSFTILTTQFTNAGGYSVIVTNSFGSVTSLVAILTVNPAPTNLDFSLYGFAQTDTGGGILSETSPFYRKVTNALDLANAIDSSTIKVIEIMTNLDLGYLEIGAVAQAVGPFRSQGNGPLLHPRLIQTGVSVLDIQGRNGLTIFSANGATIKHCCFNIKSAANIIVRNLKFDEMWEWDESSKGDYDRNDWDFIDLGNGGSTGSTSNIWVDHCTFTKAYDGICDMKGGANHITFSWNRYVGDDGNVNTNSFVRQQINALEAARPANAMYEFLRTKGFSVEDLVTILHGHDKTHLIGASSGVGNTGNAAENALLSATFHHQWYQNPWDRLPRLRGGNIHNYNILVDDVQGLAAKRMRDDRAAAMNTTDRNTLNNTYNFQIFLNGSISTENGAVLVENSIYTDCLTPLRNNQTDPSNPAYTGKIMALDTIYHFDNANGSTIDYRGSSTNAPGDAYFGPEQAAVIPFSWNLPGNQLPYSYIPDDPAQLSNVLSNYAGAGALTWAKTNWLKTSY